MIGNPARLRYCLFLEVILFPPWKERTVLPFLVLSTGHHAVGWLAFAINALILVIPVVMAGIAWHRLLDDWRDEAHSAAGISCLTFASASTLLALGSLIWQCFVRPIPLRDYRTEVSGLLLSITGVVAGFSDRHNNNRYWGLGLATAVWTFAWFLLTAFSY